jgi:hypothetical protein
VGWTLAPEEAGVEREHEADVEPQARRQPWETPQLTCLGRVRDAVQGAGGKISAVGGDPGETRKAMAMG